MPAAPLAIARIDARRPESRAAIEALRQKLAPDGNVVSEAGKRKTIEVFGEPLTPIEVVERICDDVRRRGIEAVLDYTAKLDGVRLTPETLRVSPDELAAAHRAADPALLGTVRRIRERLLRFQTAILHRDVRVEIEGGGTSRSAIFPSDGPGSASPAAPRPTPRRC